VAGDFGDAGTALPLLSLLLRAELRLLLLPLLFVRERGVGEEWRLPAAAARGVFGDMGDSGSCELKDEADDDLCALFREAFLAALRPACSTAFSACRAACRRFLMSKRAAL